MFENKKNPVNLNYDSHTKLKNAYISQFQYYNGNDKILEKLATPSGSQGPCVNIQ